MSHTRTNCYPEFATPSALRTERRFADGNSNSKTITAKRPGVLNPGKIVLGDVRSHGHYSARAVRIPGSIRTEPNNLSAEIKIFPRDKEMYLYCTCRSEVTSASVAHLLREQGFNAFVVSSSAPSRQATEDPYR